DAVLKVVEPEVIEKFQPRASGNDAESEILRVALSETHRLYCRLMKEREAVDDVIRNLVDLRKDLGRNRYMIQEVFVLMDVHVERALLPQPASASPQDAALAPAPAAPVA